MSRARDTDLRREIRAMANRAATIPTLGIWPQDRSAHAQSRRLVDDFAVLAFFFILWANLAVVATRFHGVPQIVGSAVILLLAVPLARYILVERQPLAVTPVLPLVFIFLAALLLSAALSKDPGVSRAPVVLYLTEGLLLFLIVSNAVRTTATLSRVLWVLILAASFMGALSVFQELTHTYGRDYAGLAQVEGYGTGGGFNVAPADSQQKILRPRLAGPLGSKNRYAQILAAVLPFALIRAFWERKRRLRLAAAAGSLLILGGLLLSFSRGAAVAVAVTLLFMALLRELRLRQLLVALAVITGVILLAVPDYVTRLRSLEAVTALSSTADSSQRPDTALTGRQTENLAAWNTFLDHPVVGVGPGVYFKEYSREYGNRLGVRYLHSERRGHSLYLELAADTGLVGLSAFMAMVGTALVLLYRHAKRLRGHDPQGAMVASSLFFGLFAYLACGMFLHLSYQRYFWALLGLASAAIWTLRREAEDELVRRPPRTTA
jgi:putative inorganic carbon (HCO3(-)) transporter